MRKMSMTVWMKVLEVIAAERSERAARSRPDARVLAPDSSVSRWASPPSPAGLTGTDGLIRAVGPEPSLCDYTHEDIDRY